MTFSATQTLADFVKGKVDPKVYFEAFFNRKFNWNSATEPRVMCVFHEDKATPSLSLNGDTGEWYCHGCKAGGRSIVSFEARATDTGPKEAATSIFHKFIHPVVPDKMVRAWKRNLIDTPSALNYLRKERSLSPQVIEQYDLGWNGNRVAIPVRNRFGLCVNTRLYDPLAKKHSAPKVINYRRVEELRSYGSPSEIFPAAVLMDPSTTEVALCEGEMDALTLLSLGVTAVSGTAGVKSFPPDCHELFRGKIVNVCYDNDKDGLKFDTRPVKELRDIALVIRRVRIPRAVGANNIKDVSDWVKASPRMRTKSGWIHRFAASPTLIENPPDAVTLRPMELVSLDEASRSDHFARRLRVRAIIAGKDVAPYLLPRKIRLTCDRSCEGCPLTDSLSEYREITIEPSDPGLLALIDLGEKQLRAALLGRAKISSKPSCKGVVEVVDTLNVEQVALIPPVDIGSSDPAGDYVTRNAYYSGHGLHSNRGYEFQGVTVPHPRDQHATHLFDLAKPLQDEVDTFQLTHDLVHQLKVFRPRRLRLLAHLMSIAQWQSIHVTKIKDRPDLHVAVDLAFHSVASFDFNGEQVPRGMLDVLIIGDTRCGKGYVAEGLRRFYALGELASGEACTFAGLVGGLQQIGKRWIVTWGLIPLNHGRMVIIDEASSLSETDIGHMSRVRSEGVAEISKIVRESTRASTRLLWLSNPRSGRPISSYNAGVQAIKELVGANEDISRFDYALTVATNEVSSETINTVATLGNEHDDAKYPRDLCRALVLWAWSRKSGDIEFTESAVNEVIAQAITMGHTYSAAIPLVQAENIRIKIAKVAAAIAARVFSSDESGRKLIVDKAHVECACAFLRLCYNKGSMGYDTFSQIAMASSGTLQDALEPGSDKLSKLIATFGGVDKTTLLRGLLELNRVTVDNLTDYIGDPLTAKGLISELVKSRCLARIDTGNWYLKNPSFSAWLRANNPTSNNGDNDE